MSRTALVTGAASGIGAAIAETLAKAGWAVTGIDLKPATVQLPLVADVSDAAAVAAAVDTAQATLGPIDALVTAAGHYAMAPFGDISPEEWHRILRVHLGGLRNAAHAVLPGMLDRRRGSIVAITSELAIGGGDGDAHYAAAKGAIIGFVRSLAAEVAPAGVRVNAVAPGATDTPLLAADSPWRAADYLRTVPNGRLARPGEIAQAVRFLLEDGDFCVGEVLSLNCGTVI
jgi:2-hydroxycyclohexanecarboxyl-CoA dehydrogenase